MGANEFIGPFKIGDVILDEYEVRGLLGAGGQAYVYECLDRYMEVVVAVKVIAVLPGRGKEHLGRAHAEAKLLLRLNHPNVVRVMTARPLGDSMVCIVMEKLEGLSLRQFLRLHQRLTVTEALTIVRQIAEGVGSAHRLDVIHRDIKPENVFLLPPNNHVKVLDFGIAKFMGQGLETTNKARIHGTPLYMSPEHLQNTSITVRSDIYELGTLAFELMTGMIPCLVDLENPDFNQVAYAQIAKVTPSLKRLIQDVGPLTDYFVQRATAKEPAQRFPSMDEAIEAVDAALTEQRAIYPRESLGQRFINDAMIRRALADTKQSDLGDDKTSQTLKASAAQTVAVRSPQPVMAPTIEHVGMGPNPVAIPAVSPEPATTNSPTTTISSPNADSDGESAPATNSRVTNSRVMSRAIFVVPIAIGLVIAVVVSWPDIQRYQGRALAAQSSATALAPSPVEVPSSGDVAANLSVTTSTLSSVVAEPAASTTTKPKALVGQVGSGAIPDRPMRAVATSLPAIVPLARPVPATGSSAKSVQRLDQDRAFAADLPGLTSSKTTSRARSKGVR